MEQLVIFILFVVASIVSSIIQNKKKQAEEEAERRGVPPAAKRSEPPTLPQWPKSARDWQEQLKKMLEGQMEPPPIRPAAPPAPLVVSIPTIVTRPVVTELTEGDIQYKSPFRQSSAAHERASALQSRVEARFRDVNRQTETHRPSVPKKHFHGTPSLQQRLRHNPMAAREAFVASLIFGPPKSSEP